MIVLNLKECRSSSSWNPDISPHFCNPQQTPKWLQLGPIPRGGTETEISVVAPCQHTENYWGWTGLVLLKVGKGTFYRFSYFSQWEKRAAAHQQRVQRSVAGYRVWKGQRPWIPSLWWLGRYVIGTSLWHKRLLTPHKHLWEVASPVRVVTGILLMLPYAAGPRSCPSRLATSLLWEFGIWTGVWHWASLGLTWGLSVG